jgi:hypothetical protein
VPILKAPEMTAAGPPRTVTDQIATLARINAELLGARYSNP